MLFSALVRRKGPVETLLSARAQAHPGAAQNFERVVAVLLQDMPSSLRGHLSLQQVLSPSRVAPAGFSPVVPFVFKLVTVLPEVLLAFLEASRTEQVAEI